MQLNDKANTPVAFKQELFLKDNFQVYSVSCDSYKRNFKFCTHCFVCKQYDSMDLCQGCLDGYCKGIKQMDACIDHQFLRLFIKALAEIKDFYPMTSREQRMWLKKIKVDYRSRDFLRVFLALRWQLHRQAA